MVRLIPFLLILCLSGPLTASSDTFELNSAQIHLLVELQAEGFEIITDSSSVPQVKFKRGKAILFTIFTGVLGGHRIYFGTHHRTPIIYSLTFGGLGILPLIDLVHVIFTKDLSKFQHRSQVIMWGN